MEQRLNNERKHGEDLADVNGKLASENTDLKEKTSNQVRLLEHSRITWRARAQHAEKEVEDLKKKRLASWRSSLLRQGILLNCI